MFLWRLFFTNPVMACALCICLATIFWCITILHRHRKGPDRFLAALIGAICITQGLLYLQHTGFIPLSGALRVDAFAELMITALCPMAILVLRISAIERKSTQVRLRLVEANDQRCTGPFVSLEQPNQSVSDMILGSHPLPAIGIDPSGAIIYWNSAAERLLGWKRGDVIGKPSPVSLNSPVRMKSGGQMRVESWTSAIHDSAGRRCGTLHVLAPLPVLAPVSEGAPALACDTPILAC